jgi:hypothetical protein
MPRASTFHAVTVMERYRKNKLHMVGLNSSGAIVFRKRKRRGRIASRFAKTTTLPCWHRSGNVNTLRCP